MADSSEIEGTGDSCGEFRDRGGRGNVWQIQGLRRQGTRVADLGIEKSGDSRGGFRE